MSTLSRRAGKSRGLAFDLLHQSRSNDRSLSADHGQSVFSRGDREPGTTRRLKAEQVMARDQTFQLKRIASRELVGLADFSRDADITVRAKRRAHSHLL